VLRPQSLSERELFIVKYFSLLTFIVQCTPNPQVLCEREQLYSLMHTQLSAAASALGQRLLHTPGNPISLAITLDQGSLAALPREQLTFLGAMLWAR
jgi:hypothetical protein